MERKSGCIEYLKDPYLVVHFQKYFGVYGKTELKQKTNSIKPHKSRSTSYIKGDEKTELKHRHVDSTPFSKDPINENYVDVGNHGLKVGTRARPNGNISSNPTGLVEDTLSSESDVETLPYIITIKLWYYFFLFGTYLGDEVFYASFIPFWFWNIDGAVGRRIVMVWTIVMYIGLLIVAAATYYCLLLMNVKSHGCDNHILLYRLITYIYVPNYDHLNSSTREELDLALGLVQGQGIKDIVCWPRPPSPPVFRLQKKWALEHGMPSTHAMVGIAIPFSVVIYTMNRYQYPVGLGIAIAVCWCAVISLSRIYLGMHSVLDVVVGLALAVVLMVPVVPLVDRLDGVLISSRWSPLALILITIPMIVFYPTASHWTPTRGDTTTIVSFCVGTYIGAWTNYHMGAMTQPTHPPPYSVIWPSWPMFGNGALRTVIGLCSIIATIAVCKSAQHAILRCTLRTDTRPSERTPQSTIRNTVELTCKYLSYVLLGFNILYLMPNVFKMLKIERPTFYTEI